MQDYNQICCFSQVYYIHQIQRLIGQQLGQCHHPSRPWNSSQRPWENDLYRSTKHNGIRQSHYGPTSERRWASSNWKQTQQHILDLMQSHISTFQALISALTPSLQKRINAQPSQTMDSVTKTKPTSITDIPNVTVTNPTATKHVPPYTLSWTPRYDHPTWISPPRLRLMLLIKTWVEFMDELQKHPKPGPTGETLSSKKSQG